MKGYTADIFNIELHGFPIVLRKNYAVKNEENKNKSNLTGNKIARDIICCGLGEIYR